MKFEWDERKNQLNAKKHLITFEEAIEVFSGRTVDVIDVRHSYGEQRIITIGKIKLLEELTVVVVVHTDRNGNVRIISARKANKWERAVYDANLN